MVGRRAQPRPDVPLERWLPAGGGEHAVPRPRLPLEHVQVPTQQPSRVRARLRNGNFCPGAFRCWFVHVWGRDVYPKGGKLCMRGLFFRFKIDDHNRENCCANSGFVGVETGANSFRGVREENQTCDLPFGRRRGIRSTQRLVRVSVGSL